MDLYRKIGIDPPRGVLLYGPPGELKEPDRVIQLTMDRNWKDNVGQGSRKCYQSILHPSRRIRVRAEIPRRGMSIPSLFGSY
jgi:hypothetical protein